MSPNLRTAPTVLGVSPTTLRQARRGRARACPGQMRGDRAGAAARRPCPTGQLLHAYVLGNASTKVGTVRRGDPLDPIRCRPRAGLPHDRALPPVTVEGCASGHAVVTLDRGRRSLIVRHEASIGCRVTLGPDSRWAPTIALVRPARCPRARVDPVEVGEGGPSSGRGHARRGGES
jgi:hypothetical protein